MTELVFILDKSGSMYDLTMDTIGGFNSMLEKQKQEEGGAWVSTVLFNDRSTVIHDRLPLEEVPKLTAKEYIASGTTALLDAVGGAIHHIGNIHKYARKEDVPEKTLVVIITDGMENASHRYTYRKIKEMIGEKKEKGWEFIFLGANIDAEEEAARFGIDRERAAEYRCDSAGTALNYQVVSDIVCACRMGSEITEDLLAPVRKDRSRRGRK